MRKKKWSHDGIVRSFEVHLRETCGFTTGTCKVYTEKIRRFLRAKYGEGIVNLKDLRTTDLMAFVAEQSSRYKPNTTRNISTALRNFVRFLRLKGMCDSRLEHVIPAVASWRLSSLPASLSEEELSVLLNSFDLSTPKGLRGYAMVNCMAMLGLRVGEVARLSLDDIDWRNGLVRFPKTKGRRADVLPLPDSVGRAIVAYLRSGRPATLERRIFVCHISRTGALLSDSGAKSVIRRAIQNSGIDPPRSGTHILRHTAATRMIRRGATLKEIADVLRHRSIETTTIYAKVDLTTLAEVAMPWPEV